MKGTSARLQPHVIAGILGAVLIAAAGGLVAANWNLISTLGEAPPTEFLVNLAPEEALSQVEPGPPATGGTAAAAVVLPALDAATPGAEARPLAAIVPRVIGPAPEPDIIEREPAVDRRRIPAAMPTRLQIPSIRLDVPVTASVWVALPELNAGYFDAPPLKAAGWQPSTARLGEPGNLVLSGHNNILGRVFESLKDVKAGDLIYLRAGRRELTYRVTERRLLLEKDQPINVRTQNAQYILPGGEDRLTLVTCWPPDNNTHRIIVIARPVAEKIDEQR